MLSHDIRSCDLKLVNAIIPTINNTKTTSRNIRDNKQEVKGTIALRKRGKSSKKATFTLVIRKLSRAKGKEPAK